MTTKKSGKSKRADTKEAGEAIKVWQLDHIKEGLRQADAGEFASDAEIAAVFAPRHALNDLRNRRSSRG